MPTIEHVVQNTTRAPLHGLLVQAVPVQHSAFVHIQARVDIHDENTLALRFPVVHVGQDLKLGTVVGDECRLVEGVHGSVPMLR